MHSSSTQNQGSLSSLLALSPQPTPAREAQSSNSSTSFNNTFESLRQDVRQHARQQERQELASSNATRASRDALARDRATADRADSDRVAADRAAHARSGSNAQSDKVDGTNHPLSGIKHGPSDSPQKTSQSSAEETENSADDTTTLEMSAGNGMSSPLNSDAETAEGVTLELPTTAEDTETNLLLGPDVDAALNSNPADTTTVPGDVEEALNAADESLLAALGAPLMTQTAVKTASSTENVAVMEGDGEGVVDSLLSKSPAAKTSVNGDIELAVATTGKQAEAPIDVSSKELFSRLLASQVESGLPARERVAALPLSTQAAPALDAVSRAVESLTPAGRGFVVQSGVAVPMGQPQWSQAVGDRVLWLASQNISSAELRLDPPELGPMQVRVSVQHDQVQVTFTSPHANVREALDQGATRLREMFNEQGLSVNVEVSDQALSRRQEGGEDEGRRGKGGGDEATEEVVAETPVANMRLVDHYA